MGGYMSKDNDLTIKPCPICGGEMGLVYKSRMKAFVFYHKDDKNKCCEYFKIPLSTKISSLVKARVCWNMYYDKNNIITVSSKSMESHPVGEVCSDNRFEIIERYKKKLIESTNIETSPLEMEVLDSILFRMWQMGWLKEDEIDKHKQGENRNDSI